MMDDDRWVDSDRDDDDEYYYNGDSDDNHDDNGNAINYDNDYDCY